MFNQNLSSFYYGITLSADFVPDQILGEAIIPREAQEDLSIDPSTDGRILQAAGAVPGVGSQHLAGPEDLAGIQIERHERVARRGWRIAVVVSRGDV